MFSHPLGLLATVVHLVSVLILADVIVSYAYMLGARGASPYQPWVRTLRRITEPILNPIRRILPARAQQGLDFSPVIAILVLQFIADFLARMAAGG
jgi:uncharacterized protein YggT (Ycf19 family)